MSVMYSIIACLAFAALWLGMGIAAGVHAAGIVGLPFFLAALAYASCADDMIDAREWIDLGCRDRAFKEPYRTALIAKLERVVGRIDRSVAIGPNPPRLVRDRRYVFLVMWSLALVGWLIILFGLEHRVFSLAFAYASGFFAAAAGLYLVFRNRLLAEKLVQSLDLLAYAYAIGGRYGDADRILSRLSATLPDEIGWVGERVHCLERQGRLSGARDMLESRIASRPDDRETCILLASVLLRLGDDSAAGAAIARARALGSGNAECDLYEAALLLARGDEAAARAMADEAARADGDCLYRLEEDPALARLAALIFEGAERTRSVTSPWP